MSKNGKHLDDSYIDKIKEWQDHQYDPGYYTGGRIPPYLAHPGRPNLLGWVLVISSVIYNTTITSMVIKGFDSKQLLPIVIFLALVESISVAQFIAGIRLIKKVPIDKIKKDIRVILKVLVVTLVIVALIVLSGYIAYMLNEKQGEVFIDSRTQFISMQNNDKYYIYLKNIDKKIQCSSDEYNLITSIPVNVKSEKVRYKIHYEWNNLSPKEGKVLNVIKESN